MRSFIENPSLEFMLYNLSDEKNISNFNWLIYDTDPSLSYMNLDDIDVHKFNNKGKILDPIHKFSYPEEFYFENLERKSEEAVGLSSVVDLNDGEYAHLLFLDIDYLPNELPHFMEVLKEVLLQVYPKDIQPTGSIVYSGGGFHYYGKQLSTDKEWEEYLLRARHIPEIEPNWCDIQLRRGFSVLRVSSSEFKQKPIVLFEVR